MRFLVNPMVSVRRHGKPVSRKTFHAAGFSRNAPKRKPTARQLAARKKFAAMARARAAGARKVKRAQTSKGVSMARRKRKATRRLTTGTRKRRSVSARRRRTYAANPRRHVKRRKSTAKRSAKRRSYRRNPGLMKGIGGTALELGKGALAVGVGMAASRTLGGMIPLNASNPSQQPLYDAAKGVVVAIAIKKFGGKIVPQRYADLAAIGALVTPIRSLIVGYLPSAGQYLGDGGVMAMPRFTGARRIAAYPGGVAAYAHDGMGAYSESYPG